MPIFAGGGEHDGAIESGQHALAVAETLGDVALQVMAHHYLGVTYHILGGHRQAMALLRSNVELLAGDRLRERFGLVGHPAVMSHAYLARCLAELGAFPEARAHADEAVRLAEVIDHPHSLIYASRGVGFLSLRTRDLDKAIPVLERGLELCRVLHFRRLFPETAAALGCAYACAGRVTEALTFWLPQAEAALAQVEER